MNRLLRHILLQALIVVSGWFSLFYGWGIEVKCWPVLIVWGLFLSFGLYPMNVWILHGKKTVSAAEAQGGVYPECVNQACPTFGSHGCSEGLDVDGTCECRTDISEKPDGKRPAGEPRWASPEAQSRELLSERLEKRIARDFGDTDDVSKHWRGEK